MANNSLLMIINDLRSRRDALSLCHEQLKKDSDQWNKLIIFLSLSTGLFESVKFQLRLDNPIVSLVPIFLSSIIASISALIKFKNYPTQMEIILQSQALLTNTLTTARNENKITPQLLKLYNDSLEKLEISIYPDIRKRFLRISNNNLISIMKLEKIYFNTIEMINDNKNTTLFSSYFDSLDENENENEDEDEEQQDKKHNKQYKRHEYENKEEQKIKDQEDEEQQYKKYNKQYKRHEYENKEDKKEEQKIEDQDKTEEQKIEDQDKTDEQDKTDQEIDDQEIDDQYKTDQEIDDQEKTDQEIDNQDKTDQHKNK
jgi:hypothetical protein